MQRFFLAAGALAGLTAVAMAALAAHALPPVLGPARMAMVESGIRMQGWHALALLAVALWLPRGGALARAAGIAFLVGLIGFCAGVYLLAIPAIHIPMLAPAGGSVLMLGWLLLALAALRGG